MTLLTGLDLFSGIGGITLALRDFVKPAAYCEIEPYCQSVLLQRMQEGNLPKAPIWDDIRTLRDCLFDSGLIYQQLDIIYGGFPCQDISVAGRGKGLTGERSGLFFEIVRLAKEIKPKFIFLENVPAICRRGGQEVVATITALGYDCRWCVISASQVGARHKRERWFLLAHSKHNGTLASEDWRCLKAGVDPRWAGINQEMLGEAERASSISTDVANTDSKWLEEQCGSSTIQQSQPRAEYSGHDGNTNSIPGKQTYPAAITKSREWHARRRLARQYWPFESREHWQKAVDTVCRTSDGLPRHVDRLKSLGNAVVPQCVRHAFIQLMGIQEYHA